jgi:hypothetical protein
MPTPSLPIAALDLAQQLNHGLAPRRNGLTLSVADPLLVEIQDDVDVGLQLRVTVASVLGDGTETWQVTIPVDPPRP